MERGVFYNGKCVYGYYFPACRRAGAAVSGSRALAVPVDCLLYTSQNLYWNWMHTLRPLTRQVPDGYPTFMLNQAWAHKELKDVYKRQIKERAKIITIPGIIFLTGCHSPS